MEINHFTDFSDPRGIAVIVLFILSIAATIWFWMSKIWDGKKSDASVATFMLVIILWLFAFTALYGRHLYWVRYEQDEAADQVVLEGDYITAMDMYMEIYMFSDVDKKVSEITPMYRYQMGCKAMSEYRYKDAMLYFMDNDSEDSAELLKICVAEYLKELEEE